MSNAGPDFPTTLILAGGLGSRLGTVAQKIPKCLMPVAGEPFIAHQLRLLKREGVRDVVLCLGHLGEQVEEFLGDGQQFGVNVRYVFDGSPLLGTGGAIRKALDCGALPDQHFAVTYGDSYLDVDFRSIFKTFVSSRLAALMTVLLNGNLWDKSNVLMHDGLIAVYDKKNQTADMHHIDFGLLLFSRVCFEKQPANEAFDLSWVIQRLVASGELAAHEVTERFYEIGTPQSLAEADSYIRGRLAHSCS